MYLILTNFVLGHEIRPEDIGLVTIKGEDEIQPFMVAFLKAVNNVKPRVTRDTRTKKDTFSSVMSGYHPKGNTSHISFSNFNQALILAVIFRIH